jgi:hypothetical protein
MYPCALIFLPLQSSLQACALLVNVFTLFVGIMIIISTELEDAARRAGQPVDTSERNIISVVVFAANLLVLCLPPLHALATGQLPESIPTFVVEDFFACGGGNDLGPMPDLEEGRAGAAGEAGPAAVAAELSVQELDTPSEAAHMPVEIQIPPQAALCLDGTVQPGPPLRRALAANAEKYRDSS